MKFDNLLLFLLLLIISCNKRSYDNGIDLNNQEELFISQIADSVTYIQLEMNEQCLLGDITDLQFQNNIFYILDGLTNTIYTFDENGFFLNKLSKQGKGPGEYVHLSSFFIDSKNNTHIIDLYFKKVLAYDNNGIFLHEFWIDDYVRDFCVINNEYFFYIPDYNIDSRQGLYSYSKENNQYDELVKIKGNSEFIMQQFITSLENNDNFSAVDNINNYVYYFNQNGILETKKFVFYPIAHDLKNDNMNAYFSIFYNESNSFIMWAFASIIPNNGVKIYLFDKRNQQGKVYDNVINDIDNIEIGIPTRCSKNNKFIFWRHNENDEIFNPKLQILHLK